MAFGILPMFAFANAGVSLAGHALADAAADPVPLGIALGLFVGKQIGIFGVLRGSPSRLGLARLPAGVSWRQLYGVGAALRHRLHHEPVHRHAGLRERGGPEYANLTRLGILAGSLLSALGGSLVLYWVLPHRRAMAEAR